MLGNDSQKSYARQSISYREGIKSEKFVSEVVSNYAPLKGRVPQASSEYENKVLDIDEWWGNIPLSYKYMRSSERYGTFTFEVSVFHISQYGEEEYSFTDYRDGKTYSFTGTWRDSWFQNGKALYYVIRTENDNVYMVSKEALIRYIDRHGWERTPELSIPLRVSQVKMHHPHVTSIVGVVSIQKLLDEGIAWRLN